MPDQWERDQGSDPLYRDVPLRHAVELPVLGVPVRFEANAPRALDLVEAAYGRWRSVLGRPELMARQRVRVRIVVQEGTEGAPGPPFIRMPDNERLLIHTPGSLALADVARADGVVYATPPLLEAGEGFISGVLDTIVLVLVTHFDRVPVHAAMIVRKGSALLLAAPSGTGKSSLAYAAGRAGWRVVADDTAYVQLDPRLIVWGAARVVRLPVAAGQWFDELRSSAPMTGADGDQKLVVTLPAPAGAPEAPVAERVGVCILSRSGSKAMLERLDPALVVASLASNVEPGFDRFAERMEGVLQRLSAPGGWRLHLSSDPADALPYIERMLAAVDAQA